MRIDEQDETLLTVLFNHAKTIPDHQVLTWCDQKGKESQSLTYKQLWGQSKLVAGLLLQAPEIKKGDRIMICYPFGLDFLSGLFGCMLAGMIPCSVYPPSPLKFEADFEVFIRKAKDAQAKFALTNSLLRRLIAGKLMFGRGTELYKVQFLATDNLKARRYNVDESELCFPSKEEIAFIQYTSGSTGFPKGVMISHRSVIGNCKAISNTTKNCCGVTSKDEVTKVIAVWWVPQYHDMGLIGSFMTVLYAGFKGLSFSPLHFLQDPLLWQRIILENNAHLTCAPNFAYGLLCKRLSTSLSSNNKKKKTWLTRGWETVKFAGWGGEPIDPKVVELTKSVLGLRQDAIVAMYGMAEVGVYLCDGDCHVRNGRVACGRTDTEGSTLRIVRDGDVVEDGADGEIWCQTDNVASGYWGKDDLSKKTFRNQLNGYGGEWLATGDLGRIIDGNIYITGRIKEVIIINGRNYYPVDLERTLESSYVKSLRPGCNVAYQHSPTGVGIVAEIRKGINSGEIPEVEDIGRHIAASHGLAVEKIVLLKDHTVPKTTSGKLRRVLTKEMCVENKWDPSSIIVQMERQSCMDVSSTHLSLALDMRNVDGKASKSSSTTSLLNHSLKLTDVGSFHTNASVVSTDGDFSMKTFQSVFETILRRTVSPDEPIGDLGLSSIDLAAVHERLVRKLGVARDSLPIEWMFDGEATIQTLFDRMISDEGEPPDSRELAHEDETNDLLNAAARSHTNGVRRPPDSPFVVVMVRILFQMLSIVVQALCLGGALFPIVITLVWLERDVEFLGVYFPLLISPVLAFAYFVASTLILILSKWLLQGKQVQSRCGVWSGSFARRWIVRQIARSCWRDTQWGWLNDTEALCTLHRLLGAKIGKNVSIFAGAIEDFDLVCIGDGSSVDGHLNTENVSLGVQDLGMIQIGEKSSVSTWSLIERGTIIRDNVTVDEHSLVPKDSHLPSGTRWRGLPVASQEDTYDVECGTTANEKQSGKEVRRRKSMYNWFRCLIAFVVSPYLFGIEIGLAFLIGISLFNAGGYYILPLCIWAPPTASFVFDIVLTVVMKWVLLGRIRPGRWPRYGSFHCRKWFVDHLIAHHLCRWRGYASITGSFLSFSGKFEIYLLKAFGSTAGRVSRPPISSFFCYDLLELQDGAYMGGVSRLDVFREDDAWLIGERVVLKKESFIGSRAFIKPGVTVGEGASVAGMSVAEVDVPSDHLSMGRKILKQRTKPLGQNDDSINGRLRSEEFCAVWASAVGFVGASLTALLVVALSEEVNVPSHLSVVATALMWSAILSVVGGLVLPIYCALMFVLSKSILMGQMVPGEHRYGSSWKFTGNAAWMTLGGIAYKPIIMNVFAGTWFEVFINRAMGAKIGKGAYFDYVFLLEPDLVSVGDYVSMNKFATLVPHHYHVTGVDFGAVQVGSGVNIGAHSTIHGRQTVDDNTDLEGKSLPMIGTRLTSGVWSGFPARIIDAVPCPPPTLPDPVWVSIFSHPLSSLKGCLWYCLLGLDKVLGCKGSSVEVQNDANVNNLPPQLQGTFGFTGSYQVTFQNAVWSPKLFCLIMKGGSYVLHKEKHTACDDPWWKWATYYWTFDPNLTLARGRVGLGGWVIPIELFGAKLEMNDGIWVWSHQWLNGEWKVVANLE